MGAVTTVVGFMFSHFTGLDELDNLGREIYPSIPRGWYWELLGQTVSVGGVLMVIGGLTLAFLFRREMTWARASLGAMLFSALMMIIYGVVPNQWLSLTQGELEWTSARIAVTIPKALVLNNDVSISLAAIKDAVVGGYVAVVTGAIAVAMYQWQEREKKRKSGPPPQPVSAYGRPVTRIGRG